MKYLLDTNILIYIANRHPISVRHKFEKISSNATRMSIITYGELFYGACKSQAQEKNITNLKEIKKIIPVLDLPENAGEYYGEVRHELSKKGKLIGNNDLWIAAHALSAKLILVTNNLKEFSRIPHLKIENWID